MIHLKHYLILSITNYRNAKTTFSTVAYTHARTHAPQVNVDLLRFSSSKCGDGLCEAVTGGETCSTCPQVRERERESVARAIFVNHKTYVRPLFDHSARSNSVWRITSLARARGWRPKSPLGGRKRCYVTSNVPAYILLGYGKSRGPSRRGSTRTRRRYTVPASVL